jgi:hypothetical protein
MTPLRELERPREDRALYDDDTTERERLEAALSPRELDRLLRLMSAPRGCKNEPWRDGRAGRQGSAVS